MDITFDNEAERLLCQVVSYNRLIGNKIYIAFRVVRNGQDIGHDVISLTAKRFVGNDAVAVKNINPLFGSKPHAAQFVLVNGHNGQLRQSVLTIHMSELDGKKRTTAQ
jgi:hypothetical protein